ncbi:hypothetical protein Hdeb2414_s0017g00506291 [Helianthus debilis subsp. tardiflorus]
MVENKLHGFPAKISTLIRRRTTGILPPITSTYFCTMILFRLFCTQKSPSSSMIRKINETWEEICVRRWGVYRKSLSEAYHRRRRRYCTQPNTSTAVTQTNHGHVPEPRTEEISYARCGV